jgi:hypothetical protein
MDGLLTFIDRCRRDRLSKKEEVAALLLRRMGIQVTRTYGDLKRSDLDLFPINSYGRLWGAQGALSTRGELIYVGDSGVHHPVYDRDAASRSKESYLEIGVVAEERRRYISSAFDRYGEEEEVISMAGFWGYLGPDRYLRSRHRGSNEEQKCSYERYQCSSAGSYDGSNSVHRFWKFLELLSFVPGVVR